MGRAASRLGPVVAALVVVAGSTAAAPTPPPAIADRPAAVVTAPRQVEGEGPQLPVRPESDDGRTRARADEILAGEEYQAPEPQGETAGERLRRWLDDRLPSLDGGGPNLEPLAWVVAGVVGLGAIAGITWLLATSARRRRPPDADDDLDASIEVAPLRSPSEWADEATRCAAAGDHRGAVRAHFRVLTSTLAERRLVADTPGRTVGELRQDVGERASVAAVPFGAAATLFEQVWFGDRPAGPAETDQAAQLTGDALRAAPRRARDGDRPDDDAPTATRVAAIERVDGDPDAGADPAGPTGGDRS